MVPKGLNEVYAYDSFGNILQNGSFNSFKNMVRPSKNSVIRIMVEDVREVQLARDSFLALGCQSELSNLPKLFAIEVPSDVSFGPVGDLIDQGARSGRWEYEEGVLRHDLPS